MKKINFNAAINHTGYGIASINILKELNKTHEVSYFPIGNPGVSTQEEYNFVTDCILKSQSFDPEAPCIKIWHQFDLASHIGKGEYVALPFFELDTFNSMEKIHLSVPDKIAVTSEWAKEIILNNLNADVHIVPLGVDTKIFDHSRFSTVPKNKYIFSMIGKWEIRKGHDLLPTLFQQAFPNENDVELRVLSSEHTNSYSNKDEIDRWKGLYSQDSRIKLFSGVKDHNEMAKFISDSDCGLYVSRAEGWNLELLETMAMNKPCIATNYSAHTEFCNKENCYLIDIDSKELAYDGKAFNKQGRWAKIGQKQIDQTIDYMRYVYNNRIITNPNGVNTAKKYSWAHSAKCLSGCITNT